MEEFMTRLEIAKNFLHELLRDSGLQQLYSEAVVEDYFFHPYSYTANAYKAALNIYDSLINS